MESTPDLLSSFVGCLLGLAVADAKGLVAEGKNPSAVRDLRTIIADDEYPLRYSDDTQQAIILAESLLLDNGLDGNNYARRIRMKTDQQRGVGPTLGRFLRDEKALPLYLPTNGVAMKIPPVSLFYRRSPHNIDEVVRAVAEVTHHPPGSAEGAILISRAILFALDHIGREFQPERFLNQMEEHSRRCNDRLANLINGSERYEGLDCTVYATIPPVLKTFAVYPRDFKRGVMALIESGGDTDTKASMYGAIAGAFNGVNGIPSGWISALENNFEGRDHLIGLANRLYNASEKPLL